PAACACHETMLTPTYCDSEISLRMGLAAAWRRDLPSGAFRLKSAKWAKADIEPIIALHARADPGRLRTRVLLTLNPGYGSARSQTAAISPLPGMPATCRCRARHAG